MSSFPIPTHEVCCLGWLVLGTSTDKQRKESRVDHFSSCDYKMLIKDFSSVVSAYKVHIQRYGLGVEANVQKIFGSLRIVKTEILEEEWQYQFYLGWKILGNWLHKILPSLILKKSTSCIQSSHCVIIFLISPSFYKHTFKTACLTISSIYSPF